MSYNTSYAATGFAMQKRLFSLNSKIEINYQTKTKHTCTYLNAFLMVIPNMAMKFHNFDIFYTIFEIFTPVVCSRLPHGNVNAH